MAAIFYRVYIFMVTQMIRLVLTINKICMFVSSKSSSLVRCIKRQNHRLFQLVKDLLLLSRMAQQALPVKRQLCCLNDLISDVEEEFAAKSDRN